MRLLGYSILLEIPDETSAPASQVNITLDSITLSPGTDLQTWVDLRNQLGATENPRAAETTVTPVETATLPFAQVGDQVVYQVIEHRLLHNEVIWLAKGELVFMVMNSSADPQVHEQFFQLASALTFDAEQLAALRTRAQFSGNEQQMRELVASLQPQPTPECDIVCRDQQAYDAMMAGQEGLSPLATPPAP